MGGKKGEDFELDDSTLDFQPIELVSEERTNKRTKKTTVTTVTDDEPISCLRNEIITVKHIPRETGMITNPKHVFYGGMAENATRAFTVPILESSNTFVNVLTNNEKNFLEQLMGLEPNALSVYLKNNNYWENYQVRLGKGVKYLNLSDPDDYIKYKVLLANRDLICPSLDDLSEKPKATYQYVIIAEKEESKQANKKLTASMEAFMILGKIKENKKLLKLIVETIDGRPISDKSDLDFIQGKAYSLIQADAKLFISVANDPLLEIKLLISECVQCGLIRKRADYYYLVQDNSPMCENVEEPTLTNAARYIGHVKRQELKLSLEAKVKNMQE